MEPGKLLEASRDEALAAWKREAHEDTDIESPPEELTKFAFGPMPEAIEARKKSAEEAKKKAEEDAKKAAEEAKKKAAEEEAKKKAATARGGE